MGKAGIIGKKIIRTALVGLALMGVARLTDKGCSVYRQIREDKITRQARTQLDGLLKDWEAAGFFIQSEFNTVYQPAYDDFFRAVLMIPDEGFYKDLTKRYQERLQDIGELRTPIPMPEEEAVIFDQTRYLWHDAVWKRASSESKEVHRFLRMHPSKRVEWAVERSKEMGLFVLKTEAHKQRLRLDTARREVSRCQCIESLYGLSMGEVARTAGLFRMNEDNNVRYERYARCAGQPAKEKGIMAIQETLMRDKKMLFRYLSDIKLPDR